MALTQVHGTCAGNPSDAQRNGHRSSASSTRTPSVSQRPSHGSFDLTTGTWRNDATGASGSAPVLPDLVLEIMASGGVMPRLAEQGFLPPELADSRLPPAALTSSTRPVASPSAAQSLTLLGAGLTGVAGNK